MGPGLVRAVPYAHRYALLTVRGGLRLAGRGEIDQSSAVLGRWVEGTVLGRSRSAPLQSPTRPSASAVPPRSAIVSFYRRAVWRRPAVSGGGRGHDLVEWVTVEPYAGRSLAIRAVHHFPKR